MRPPGYDTLPQGFEPAPGLALGSVLAPTLGLHVHVAVRDARLVAVRLARAPHHAEADEGARPFLHRLERYLKTGHDDLSDLPVDLSGVTGFHRVVLDALLAHVKPGEVVTYGELARMVGNPAASRAVGAAMARNPIPVVVPCHRVIGAAGNVTNYSGEGGWETKRALLRLEGAPGAARPQAQRALF